MRTIHVSCQRPTNVVCVVGTELVLDLHGCAPAGAETFEVRRTTGVEVMYRHTLVETEASLNQWPLGSGIEVVASMDSSSNDLNDNKISVRYYGKNKGTILDKARIYFTGVEISLDVDTSRDGKMNRNKCEQASWTWGPNGQGAILLVNCDREEKCICSKGRDMFNHEDLTDLSLMMLRIKGPSALFDTHCASLHITPAEADKVCVYHANATKSGVRLKYALGEEKLVYQIPQANLLTNVFYVEGIAFPDKGFSGVVSIGVTLLDCSPENVQHVPIFTRSAVFRVTPWIMTPNTLKPLEVYVSSVEDNRTFVKQMIDLVKKTDCKLTVCPKVESRGDRWMQDEMEFGYIQAPRKSFPVVLDSPRNRGLDGFPFKRLLGPDFGYWTREPYDEDEVNSLDSFGNLEVSPPVTVNGAQYPLGRILFGGSLPMYSGRRMNQVVRDFLYAQQVQSPVELYSDWLAVGHVDEFMSFVPAPSKKGFRLLLASPFACCQLFEEKQKEGYGNSVMFEGRSCLEVEHRSIDEILADKELMDQNKYVQGCIDWNRSLLKKELGLEESDIIDLPILFKMHKDDRLAVAYFPDMVNMIVLGNVLGIPKPFGPVINGKCCLEEKTHSLLEPLGLDCYFIDDFASYHLQLGEVHCGSNVRREPFDFKWWNLNIRSAKLC